MRPKTAFLSVAFTMALGIAYAAADDPKDKGQILGTWRVASMEYDGNAPPEGYLKSLQFVFSDDKMVFTSTPPNGPTNKSEFSYKLDPTTKPKSLDVSPVDGPDKGKFGAAIYDLDGDTLKLCLPRGATKERPTEFRSPQGSQHGYFVLKRIKP